MWHMICGAKLPNGETCGMRLFNYDAARRTCKRGHVAARVSVELPPAPAPKRWPWERILVLAALAADAAIHLLT
jgi:hypothetical protein